MIPGAICDQEYGIGSNNLLAEAHNFNYLQDWFKSVGGTNATILNDLSNRRSYSGIGCVKLDFTGNVPVTFNMGTANISAGSTPLSKIIQRDGLYVLSYAFYKSDVSADITFTVYMYVNGVLAESRKIEQNLFNTSGFVDGKWNIYFQSFTLAYSDVVDFEFVAHSDTTGVQLYFDRFKLEIADKGVGTPTLYSEAPLAVIEEENMFSAFTLADGESITMTHVLTGARINDANRGYPLVTYPAEFMTKGLTVHMPLVTADNVIKTIISNHTGVSVTVADNVMNYRIARQ